jgi:quinoprotein glucose dehydrogenase
MAGTPYAVHWRAFLTSLGIPCQQPPYGFLTAVNLRTQQILWRHRLGNAENSGPLGVPLHLKLSLGAPNIGGSAVTAGGVIFIAATQDQYFRAIDEATGRVLWETRLASGAHATPMTYRGQDGNQYVLVAAGGNPSFGTSAGDALIAFKLGCSKTECS